MTGDELEKWLETSARLLHLEIPEVCQAGVLENLQRNFAIGQKLMEFPLPDVTEPAPIFSA